MLLWTALSVKGQSDPHEVIRLAIANAKAVKSAAFQIENTERFNGELRTGSQQVRYQQHPFQVFMTFVHPDPGATITYDASANAEKMVYDPEGFPYMKIELDPLGTMARNNNQHTIYELGFDHIGRLIELIYSNYEQVTLLSDAGAAEVHRVQISSKRRGMGTYAVGKGESTRSISEKLNISEYKLVELNQEVREYGELKPGMTLKVPEYYALETTLEINKASLLPVKLSLSDELGLLAAYSISNIVLDVEVLQPSKKKAKLSSTHQ